MEPLKAFYDEYSKDGKSQMVFIDCDQTEGQYKEHLKSVQWSHTIPFNVDPEVIDKLEDAANADIIPKVSVFSVARGFEKPVVADIKGPILRLEAVADQISAINSKILDGEENFNKVDDDEKKS